MKNYTAREATVANSSYKNIGHAVVLVSSVLLATLLRGTTIHFESPTFYSLGVMAYSARIFIIKKSYTIHVMIYFQE